ncbi:aminoacyl-tRNA hydrolase [Desulfothermobacter acidiphilus]|uniref:aminoacyl-tRNA hydrolase n=1 Tax=Desulfothermobacter acidiphilus TaxID=1938353 RepID=UPI003F8C43C7
MGERTRIRAVIGLGNPGPHYAFTRHNLGFMVLDRLASRHHLSFRQQSRWQAMWAKLPLEGGEVHLLKPLTYMNLSGEAVRRLSQRYSLRPEEILVVYDDMDLPPGRLKLALSGSAGGHRGMASVLEALGTPAVPRLRLGIGRPPEGMDPALYVLTPFAPDELPEVDRWLDRAVMVLECVLREGMLKAMNKFHQRQQ